ncbi:MAG: Uma2 family endonuclease [Cyanobacteria bacterium J06629_19]
MQVISEYASARIPDLLVHSEASIKAILQDSKLLRLDAPVPTLVVEVVSSSNTDKASRDRDYVFKRTEYAHRGIPEYWIIDPEKSHVLILTLSGKQYTENRYTEKQLLAYTQFPAINLTAEQVLSAGISS